MFATWVWAPKFGSKFGFSTVDVAVSLPLARHAHHHLRALGTPADGGQQEGTDPFDYSNATALEEWIGLADVYGASTLQPIAVYYYYH